MKLKIISIYIITFLLTVKSVPAQEKLVFSTFPAGNSIAKICQAIMETAYEKIGIEVIIQHHPPARALQLANEGHTDGELFRNVIIDGKFPNLIMVPVPILHPEVVVFTKINIFTVQGWESLRPYRIGVQRGYKLGETRTKGMTTQSASLKQVFEMLNAGRVDVVVETRLGGSEIIKTLQLKGISILTPPLEKGMVHHFLHKKHQELVPKLTEILEMMKKTGEIDTIKKQVEEALYK